MTPLQMTTAQARDEYIDSLFDPIEHKPRATKRRPIGPCGWVHSASDAVAVGRFQPTTPTRYVAKSGGPSRATRAEAEADQCVARHTDGVVRA